MASPFENITLLTNTISGATFPCTCKEISAPYTFRTALIETTGSPGAYDAHSGASDPMKFRTVVLSIIHVYNQNLPAARQTPGLVETYSSVMAAFDAVCALGAPVQLTMQDAAGTLWYQTARVSQVDKKEALADVSSVDIPVTFLFPDPFWAAQYKSGILRANTGLYANSTPTLYANADPDLFAITTSFTGHVVVNGGYAPDLAPTIILRGPLPGPITIQNGSVLIGPGRPMALQYTASIAAGETVIINSEQVQVTSTNGAVYAYGNLAPLQAGQDSWFRIAVGNNNIYVSTGSTTGNNGHVTITWKPRKA